MLANHEPLTPVTAPGPLGELAGGDPATTIQLVTRSITDCITRLRPDTAVYTPRGA
jgi:hypothetical protein